MAYGGEKSFYGLAGKGAAAPVAHRDGNHNREARMHFLDAVQGRFCVEGVKGGLQKEKVHAPFYEGPGMGGSPGCRSNCWICVPMAPSNRSTRALSSFSNITEAKIIFFRKKLAAPGFLKY